MSEKSILWTTGATGDGASAYTQAELFAWLRRTFGEGVHKRYSGGLVATGATSPVQIATGAAVVYGAPYENGAAVNVAIATPVGATRIDRIVLRADWTAQTTRITRIAGAEGGAAPAITQNYGVVWDLLLYRVSITTGGAITLTDERVDVQPNIEVITAMLATNALSANATGLLKMQDGYLAASAGGRAKMADAFVTHAKLGIPERFIKGMVMPFSGTFSGHFPVDPDTTLGVAAWHLCNGDTENGVVTPNLADQFVIAAGATYAANAHAGAAAKDVRHTHAKGTLAGASHTHGYGTLATGVPSTSDQAAAGHDFWAAPHYHFHEVNYGATGANAVVVSGDTASGGSVTQDVMPPYYSLAYICYVGA